MKESSFTIAVFLLVIFIGTGCSKKPPANRDSAHNVDTTKGYLRLRAVEPKNIRYVVTHLAELKQWNSTANDEMGSYDPRTKDDFVRAVYIYQDQDAQNIRIEWVYEKGHDAIVLISADPSIRESISAAIGVNILRREQGLPWLAK